MSAGWFGGSARRSALRAEAIERELEATRTALAAIAGQMAAQGERAQAMTLALSQLGERVAALESQATEGTDRIAQLRGAVSRVERQLDFAVEESRKTATGLLARIDAAIRPVRPASPLAPAAEEEPSIR